MTTWDYSVVTQTHGLFGHKQGIDKKAFEKHLDTLGQDGFELVWVLPDQQLHGERDANLFIFKRPANSEETP